MKEKFICLECNEIFEEPGIYKIEDDEYIEEYFACPFCEGAYRQAVKCSVCGEYVNEEDIEIIDKDFICPQCYDKLGK